jgi:hypothetical protein
VTQSRRQFVQNLLAGGVLATGAATWLQRADRAGAQSPPNLEQAPPPDRGDLRIIAISDLNNGYGETDYRAEVHQAIALIQRWQPDLVVCGGDMVAGQKLGLTRSQFQAMWAGFDRTIYQPLRQGGIPFAFTLGNHDASNITLPDRTFKYALDRNEAAAYWRRQRSTMNWDWVDDAWFPFFYAFRMGNALIVSWDASGPVISTEQLLRAEQLFTSEVGRAAQVRLLLGHMPLHAVTPQLNQPGTVLRDTTQVQSLLERAQVTAYITGHHHAYFPARMGTVDLLHLGCLGGGARSWLGTSSTPIRTLTVIDARFGSPNLRYSSYQLNPFRSLRDDQLPREIVGFNGRLVRRDQLLAKDHALKVTI